MPLNCPVTGESETGAEAREPLGWLDVPRGPSSVYSARDLPRATRDRSCFLCEPSFKFLRTPRNEFVQDLLRRTGQDRAPHAAADLGLPLLDPLVDGIDQ